MTTTACRQNRKEGFSSLGQQAVSGHVQEVRDNCHLGVEEKENHSAGIESQRCWRLHLRRVLHGCMGLEGQTKPPHQSTLSQTSQTRTTGTVPAPLDPCVIFSSFVPVTSHEVILTNHAFITLTQLTLPSNDPSVCPDTQG